jgi:pimeloyl-ACP methyl ester carboxylesterase
MKTSSLSRTFSIAVALLLTMVLITPPSASAMDFGLVAQSQLATMVLMKDMKLGVRSSLRTVREVVSEAPEADYVEVVLEGDGVGTIRLMLKGPRGFYALKDHRARGLFVASGLFAGRETVKVVNNLENMVIIGFEYPYSAEQMGKQPKLIYEFMRLTSAQIAATLQWVSERGFQNPYELYSIGVSLGGLFLPSSLHIAQTLGVPVKGSVFAYTGAELSPVVAKGLAEKTNGQGVQIATSLVQAMTLVHDPKLHLPFLRGSFLTIRGDADQVFPLQSSTRLEELLPQPKTNAVLPGGHINVDQTELISKTQDLIKDWLGQ